MVHAGDEQPRRRRGPGSRAGLTRDDVLRVARTRLAREGLAGLTMRGLAADLGVAPNALYSHVADKTELVDLVLDETLGQVALPGTKADTAPVVDPEHGLTALLVSTYEVLIAAPDLVPLYLARQGSRGPNAQQLGAVMRGFLSRLDVTGPAADEALRVLVIYTIGFAALGRGFPSGAQEPSGPPLGEHELAANFRRGLGWLLTGIATSPTPTADARDR